QGDQDLLVPLVTNGARVFERARSPRTLVTLAHGTHTAFVTYFTGSAAESYDQIGCAAIAGVATLGDIFAGLGGPRAGIDPTGCALRCQAPPPDNPPMSADEQHRLTKVEHAAVFDATLKGSAAASCFPREVQLPSRTDAEGHEAVPLLAAGQVGGIGYVRHPGGRVVGRNADQLGVADLDPLRRSTRDRVALIHEAARRLVLHHDLPGTA